MKPYTIVYKSIVNCFVTAENPRWNEDGYATMQEAQSRLKELARDTNQYETATFNGDNYLSIKSGDYVRSYRVKPSY